MTAVLRAAEPSAGYLVEVEPTLTRGFELLVTAPSGIARLRELICSFAVRGKLMPQDPLDQPAAGLLAPLRRERARLTEAGRVRKDRDADEAIQHDLDLPRGWAAARLADVAWPQAGFAFKSSAFNDACHGLPLIRIRDVGANSPTMYFSGEFREEFIVRPGDWLIGMDGDFRVAQWSGPDALLNQRVTRLVFFGDEIKKVYVTLALQIELRKLQGTKAYTTVDHLSGSQIASRIIALPPLAEQHRIVARVEELMKLCDALEQSGRLADEQHARLTSTLFDALAASESAHALAENWQRVAEHFDLLLDRPDAIDALEQTVLRLAVRGLLVSQELTDGLALELVAEIADEKRRLVNEGQIRPDKEMPGLLRDEQAFQIPNSWAWIRFGHASINRDGERIPVASTDRENLAKIYDYYGASGVIDKIDRFLFDKTLLLIGEDGANLINRSTPIAFLAHGKFWVNNHAHVIDVSHEGLLDYLCLYVNATPLEPYVTGTAQPKMNQSKLNSIPVALPPLAEQKRIVARVEELRCLCADLRQRLTQARETQSSLADSLVTEIA